MAKSLLRSESLSFEHIKAFYTNRLRRIVPIFLVIIIVIIVSGRLLMYELHRLSYNDALSTIMFDSNKFTTPVSG